MISFCEQHSWTAHKLRQIEMFFYSNDRFTCKNIWYRFRSNYTFEQWVDLKNFEKLMLDPINRRNSLKVAVRL